MSSLIPALDDCGRSQPHKGTDLSRYYFTEKFAIDTLALRTPPQRDEIGCWFYDSTLVPLYQPQPDFPKTVSASHLRATVWVSVFVDTAGAVRYSSILSSDSLVFNRAALEASIQWIFKPAVLKGKRVAAWAAIPFRFVTN